MLEHLMERLVLDVVMGVIGDDSADITLASDFSDLDVDQLTMTHIVLELEARLGIELPSELEDTRTVADLVAGTKKALSASIATLRRPPECSESVSVRAGRPLPGRQLTTHRTGPPLRPWRPRRFPLSA